MMSLRSMYLLPLLLIFCVPGAKAQCDLALTETHTNLSCPWSYDGSITLEISGGMAPYTINTINGSDDPTEDTSITFDGRWAGDNTFDVTDANGCSASLNVILEQPEPIWVLVDGFDASCSEINDGNALIFSEGGTAPLTYYWNGLEIHDEFVDGLGGGTYSLVVTDAHGCFEQTSVTIHQPDPITASIDVTDVSCYGWGNGSAEITVTGGTAPYRYYIWGGRSGQTGLTDLRPDYYYVSISDRNGCFGDGGSFVIAEPEELSAAVSVTNVTCFNDNNGTATPIVNGGTAPYTYYWWDFIGANVDPGALSAGDYSLFVIDDRGCDTNTSFVVESEICDELALVPTAITANGDGENDTFRVLANDVGAIQLNVYDMFGQPVFSTTDVRAATETGWDGTSQGKNVPSGWYIWTLQGKYTDGRPLTSEGGQRGRLVLSRP